MQVYHLNLALGIEKSLKNGTVTLVGQTGKRYLHKALLVDGYGWVPCSRKLQRHFTNDPKKLLLVVSDPDDEFIPYTSNVWVTFVDSVDISDLLNAC